MNKLIFIALTALLVMPLAVGETVFERSFAEMGYESFLVDGAQKRGCQEVNFLFPETLTEGKIYPIASIGLELGPIQEGKIDVNATLNGEKVAGLELQDFKCQGEKCWERLALPEEKLLEQENSLEICLGTGNAITSITLSNESTVGIYQTAEFSDESSFVVEVESTNLIMGEKTTVKILLHNQGSGSTFVRIEYARPVAEDKNSYSVVEGDNYFSGIINAGETVEISYVVKPRKAVHMTLPPAIVYYENEFGETESRFSNLVELEVREPEKKIEAFFVKEKEAVFVGQQIAMKLVIKNIGLSTLQDFRISLVGDTDFSQTEHYISTIMAKETRELAFTASSLETGKFQLGCEVSYVDQSAEESQCQPSFVEFKEQETNPLIYVAVAFVAIAVIVYIYIMKS